MRLTIPLFILFLGACMLSCNNPSEKGKFSVMGKINNMEDQKIYLEQLYFSQKNPEVMDTADIKKGAFTVSAKSTEEGLYRLRMEKMNAGFIFINDQPTINFTADINDVSLEGPKFNTPANRLLKNLIISINTKTSALQACNQKAEAFKAQQNDSLFALENNKLNALMEDYHQFIIRYIDTCSNPVVTMFALGYTREIDPALLSKSVSGLTKRFPKHSGIASIVTQYNQMMAQVSQPKPATNEAPVVGSMAPDITMNDVNDQPFSLSQLKGKYVLVDFWASWCGPCRGENPNIVAAYQKYKSKNFTVLGVSLDEDKAAWLKAIKDDQLTWKHISDLKGWGTAAVPLYGFDGIPYNVLIDPQGKIIATGLRENALQEFLEKTLP